jgi:hypothetical protein
MNAPHFNTTNLQSPFGSSDLMANVITMEKRFGGKIDAPAPSFAPQQNPSPK